MSSSSKSSSCSSLPISKRKSVHSNSKNDADVPSTIRKHTSCSSVHSPSSREGRSADAPRNSNEIQQEWLASRYSVDSKLKFEVRFENMKKWVENDSTRKRDWHPIRAPFPPALCISYLDSEMSRVTEAHEHHVGDGTIYQTILMLIWKGFSEGSHTVPPDLRTTLFQGLEKHKQDLAALISEGKQPLPDRHAQNLSWQAIEYGAKMLHDAPPSSEPRAPGMLLFSVQSVCRGERSGKVINCDFGLGEGRSHITAGKRMTGKRNKKGEKSYDKRFAANPKKPHMCFLTWLGIHLLTCERADYGTYLFMTRDEERDYEQKLLAEANKKRRKRSFGPHTKFKPTIARVYSSLSPSTRVALGMSKTKGFTMHCSKKAAFARILALNGVDQMYTKVRAEHCTGNFGVYGTKPIADVPNSGGPPPTIDMTMAKALSGNEQYEPDFNAVPPHFSDATIRGIRFQEIIPCYRALDEGMKSLLPLVLAQVVHHYVNTEHSLNSQHKLFSSKFFMRDPNLRNELHSALRGGDYGYQPSSLKPQYPDRVSEQHTMCLENTKRSAESAKDMQNLTLEVVALKQTVEQLSRVAADTLHAIRLLPTQCNLANDASRPPQEPSRMESDDGNYDEIRGEEEASAVASTPDNKQKEGVGKSGLPVEAPQPLLASNSDGFVHAASFQIFKIEDGIDVKEAWCLWHGKPSAYAFKKIDVLLQNSPCLPPYGKERTKFLGVLSKIRKLVEFIQGKTLDVDVEVDVLHAWHHCKQGVIDTLTIHEWPFHGSVCSAYLRLGPLFKSDKTNAERCCNRIEVIPPLRLVQPSISLFFDSRRNLLEPDIVIHDDEDTGQDGHDMLPLPYEQPSRECFCCSKCPDSGNSKGTVVYASVETLWQHWDSAHKLEEGGRPFIYDVFRVTGMK